jgi:Bardet-Biedl syndrome 1 protein
MTALKKTSGDDAYTASMIVAGTEGGMIYIIDNTGYKIISKFKIPSVPYQINSIGAYEIDYRLYVVGRNNCIYTVKNGDLQQSVIEVPFKIVGVVRTEKSVIVGTMNSAINSYHASGKKLFTLKLPAPIICIESLESRQIKNFKGYMVALKNAEVRIYNEKLLVNLIKLSENIFSLKYGKFGREDDCLVLITETGSLIIKALQRNIALEVIYKFTLRIQVMLRQRNQPTTLPSTYLRRQNFISI